MKRFRTPQAGVLSDSAAVFHWKFDGTNASLVFNDAYRSTGELATIQYRLQGEPAASPISSSQGAFADAPNGSKIAPFWFSASSPSLNNAALKTNWSLAFYALNSGAAATGAWVEYSSRETIDTNTGNHLGVYTNTDAPNATLSIRWDITTATQQIVDVPLGTRFDQDMWCHFGLVHKIDPVTPTRGTLSVFANGELLHTAASTWVSTLSGNTSNWILGASRRFGTGTGASPAFQNGGPQYDDFVFWNRAMSPAKMRSVYGDAVRPWDEAALLRGGQYRVEHRVLVFSNNEWVDLSAFRGRNWCVSARVTDSVEAEYKKADIVLHRRFGRYLDLSRLNTDADLTYGRTSQPMVDLRTPIQIEYAVVPTAWEIQGWEWVNAFDGFVDDLDWGSPKVTISACAKDIALADVYRTNVRRYEYGVAGTPVETHIRTLIDHNTPVVKGVSDASGWTPGYLGGTPDLLVNRSPNWNIRFDHSNAGTVTRIIKNNSDQLAWDCRYRHQDNWGEDVLSLYEPPRTTLLPIRAAREDSDGFAVYQVAGGAPHGLQVGQTVTVGWTTNFNGGARVIALLDDATFKTDLQPSGTPASESTGGFVYGPAAKLLTQTYREIRSVSANAEAIRNQIEIRYDRKDTAVTFPLVGFRNVGSNIGIYTRPDLDVSRIEAGADLTIVSSTPSFVNDIRAVVGPLGANGIELTPAGGSLGGSSFTSATGVFYSSYLGFSKHIAVNTASIVKFGLRTAGIFEGSVGGIDNINEAVRLGEGVLSDLAYPTVDLSGRFKCLPWLDIYDLITLEADPLGRFGAPTTDLITAVVSYEHTFGEDPSTSLTLRHDHPTRGTAWLKEWGLLANDVDPGLLDNNIDPPTGIQFRLNTNLGQSVGIHSIPPRGKSGWLWDQTEVYIGADANPYNLVGSQYDVQGQLAWAGRGNKFDLSGSYNDNLVPGQTYYAGIRRRDKHGNFTPFYSTTTSFVPRFTTLPAAARAHLTNAASHPFLTWPTNASSAPWQIYPFTDDSSSPGFDNWNNFVIGSANTAKFAHLSSTAWVMPCNGTVEVAGFVQIEHSPDDAKGFSYGAFGLFLQGSTLPNSSTSLPYKMLYMNEAGSSSSPLYRPPAGAGGGAVAGWGDGRGFAFTMGSNLPNSAVSLSGFSGTSNTGVTAAFLTFKDTVTANSGDRLFLAFRPEPSNATQAWRARGAAMGGSTPWIQFTLLAQN